jgi:hypothetical protein
MEAAMKPATLLNIEMNQLKLEQLFLTVYMLHEPTGSDMPKIITVHLVGHAGRQSWLTVTLDEQAALICVNPQYQFDLTVLL